MTATVVVLNPQPEEDLMPTRPDPDGPPTEWRPLGLAEIAFVFGVNDATPTRWKYLSGRTKFPPPDGHTSRTVPFWYLRTLRAWALAMPTKRWPGDDVVALRLASLAERDAAEREEAGQRAADLERRAEALREVADRRADAERLRDQLLALQRELDEATAAAEAAARRAAVDPVEALAG